MENVIVFRSRASGDGECFCWIDVPEGRRKQIVGDGRNKRNIR